MARYRMTGNAVAWLVILAVPGLVAAGCGTDDQPGAGGALSDAAGSGEGGGVDASLVDGGSRADGTTDGGQAEAGDDASTRDVEIVEASGGDSDLLHDSSADGTAACGAKSGLTNRDDAGVCALIQGYSCGTDDYQIDCECPAASCSCAQNGNPIGSPVAYAGCPTCSTPNYAMIATSCGIPY